MLKSELEKAHRELKKVHRALIKENELLKRSAITPSKQDKIIADLQKNLRTALEEKYKVDKQHESTKELYRDAVVSRNIAKDIIEESKVKRRMLKEEKAWNSKQLDHNIESFRELGATARVFTSLEELKEMLLKDLRSWTR